MFSTSFPFIRSTAAASSRLSCSRAGGWAFLAFIVASAVFFAVSMTLGLALLTFFIVIGAIDLMASWGQIATDPKAPLDQYGILFSAAWYLLTIALFIGIIVLIAGSRLPGSEIAVHILKS